ncbi:hypothetical protein PENSPDRAFT_103033 [Peniophora sp. CONT]|nr:hypothetical protein PENSPDRAFT_103033 [Peniophora sp. CONT]
MLHQEQGGARDKYHCVLQGSMDTTYFRKLSPSERRAAGRVMVEATHAAHIIPHKLSTPSTKPVKSMNSPTIWTIFSRGADLRIDEPRGEQINNLDNILTLSSKMQDFFEQLLIWFAHVEGNTYRVESINVSYLLSVSQNPVTFTSTDPALPLPNPEYLELHRACARVFHLSGVDEYIEGVIQREESLKAGRTLTPQTGLDLYEILAAFQPTTSIREPR